METPSEPQQRVRRRTLLALAATAPLTTGAVTATARQSAAHEVDSDVNQIPLLGELTKVSPDRHTSDLSPTEQRTDGVNVTTVYGAEFSGVSPFQLVALTWAEEAHRDIRLLVRTRLAGEPGWSSWFSQRDDGHGPDPGTLEAQNARFGTDPALVQDSTDVQVRLETTDGVVPDDLRLELISPGVEPEVDLEMESEALEPSGVSRPTIRRRKAWNANEKLRESGKPDYGKVKGAFVHHTAGANGYSKNDVPGIIRGVYAYHVKGRGWRDIGYNFVIDRFGRIWEGRYGGIGRAVVGAHTLSHNTEAFGVAVLGTYSNNTPTGAILHAFEKLIAWKFARHGVGVKKITYSSGRKLSTIAGHRAARATECPGDRLNRELPVIRAGVRSIRG